MTLLVDLASDRFRLLLLFITCITPQDLACSSCDSGGLILGSLQAKQVDFNLDGVHPSCVPKEFFRIFDVPYERVTTFVSTSK